MAKFSKDSSKNASKQASAVVRAMTKEGSLGDSARTIDNIESTLKTIASNFFENDIKLKEITTEQAQQYLADRAVEVGQSKLNMERQTLDKLLTYTGQLESGEKLEKVVSEKAQVLESRAYTQEQIAMITDAQQTQNSLSTQIAAASGLRAHELLTIERISERQADTPQGKEVVSEGKFDGLEANYTVQGKGGLIREVYIPPHLAEKLEERRLDTPRHITDRGVHYQQKYDINGGQKWSNSFSQASNRVLSWSNGAHGLRHTYAQERMGQLAQRSYSYNEARTITSQELGHFRPSITEVYLR